jgi:hypothetical protein
MGLPTDNTGTSSYSNQSQDDLYKRQQQMANYAAAAGGAASLYGQWNSDYHSNDNINVNSPGQEVDVYGKPTYNLGQLQQNIGQIDTSGDSFGGLAKRNLSGSLQGASAGFSAGGPWGALIGGIIGGVGGIVEGYTGASRARKRKQLALSNLRNAQHVYNAHMVQYNQQLAGQSIYEDQQNNQSRDFNIYKFNSPYSG